VDAGQPKQQQQQLMVELALPTAKQQVLTGRQALQQQQCWMCAG
jgi:hypothetical protein